jgi:hypothetical protein
VSVDALAVVATVALIFSSLCLLVLVPVVAKVFFATHTREFLPLDEYAQIQRDLKAAVETKPDPDDEEDYGELTEEQIEAEKIKILEKTLWNGIDEAEVGKQLTHLNSLQRKTQQDPL